MKRRKRPSEAEDFYKKLRTQEGCEVLRGGWPDFLVINPDGSIELVEVKSVHYVSGCRVLDKLSYDQERIHKVLKKMGIKVSVFYYNKNNQEELNRLEKVQKFIQRIVPEA